MSLNSILIAEYSADWPLNFERLKAVYLQTLAGIKADVQHVGSTSVPGLAAKPVIDIDIIIESKEELPDVVAGLVTLGYEHVGDLGIAEREAFKPTRSTAPVSEIKHNLYVCIKGSVSLQNHLVFRDYLRLNADEAMEYGTLKKHLAQNYFADIDMYVQHKTAFITSVLEKCGFSAKSLNDIAEQNTLK